MYYNMIVSLLLLLFVLVPFLGILYSVLNAWLQASPVSEVSKH